jgi:ketosteroid isomerase-like protein
MVIESNTVANISRMPNPGHSRRGRNAAAVLLAASLAACFSFSCHERTSQEEIAAVLADLAACVEDKDADGLVAHLADDYRDGDGRDRAATRAMAEGYFSRFRGIKIKLLSSRIAVAADNTAEAQADVSFFSGVASALRKAVGFSGENYRVTCLFRRLDAWKMTEASWVYVPLEGLFPESLDILRGLFPDL